MLGLFKKEYEKIAACASRKKRTGGLSAACCRSLWLVPMLIFCCLQSFAQASRETGDNGELVLGVRYDAPPFSSCDGKSTDTCHGYSVSLCEQIAERAVKEGLACGYRLKKVSVSDRFTALLDGDIDMLCGASTVTLERMRVADFTLFTFLSGISVMYDGAANWSTDKKNGPIAVGILQDTTTGEQIDSIWQEIRSDLSAAGREYRVINFPDHFKGLEALMSGGIRAYIADREILLELRRLAGDWGQSLQVSRSYFSIEPYGLGLRLGANELRYIANKVLSELFAGDVSGYNEMGIIAELKNYFPDSTFSRSLREMFSNQRLNAGTPIAPPVQTLQCSEGKPVQ